MRVLVTGAHGFVGHYVVNELLKRGHHPIGLDGSSSPGVKGVETHTCDLRDVENLNRLVGEIAPEGCIHLAGIAFVPLGWTDPDLVFSVNLTGTINLLEALRAGAPTAHTLVVTSAEVYGRAPAPHPLTERAPLTPSNLYAVSKVAADLSSLLYHKRYGMHVMTARPQNHVGPGQSSQFVLSAFAEQLAQLAKQPEKAILRVGNLDCRRDFTDVRDVVRAYALLIEKGRAGESYNIASGTPLRIGDMLDQLCTLAGIQPEIQIDADRFRPTDDPPVIATDKILEHVGWKPEIPLKQTLRDIYVDVADRETGSPQVP